MYNQVQYYQSINLTIKVQQKFVVKNKILSIDNYYLTNNGNFFLTRDLELINNDGSILLGYNKSIFNQDDKLVPIRLVFIDKDPCQMISKQGMIKAHHDQAQQSYQIAISNNITNEQLKLTELSGVFELTLMGETSLQINSQIQTIDCTTNM